MTKIGILTCRNSTQEAGCCSAGCLMEQNRSTGRFADYAAGGGSILLGIITCAGCPTSVAPDRILSRVKMLESMGAERIHFSTCLVAVCPFKDKFRSIIEDRTAARVVMGTHGNDTEDAVVIPAFQQGLKEILCQNTYQMADFMNGIAPPRGH